MLPTHHAGMVYLEFLPRLCAKREVRNYLEIGVHFGHMLGRISCDTAVGVDPGYILDTNVMPGKRRVFLYQSTSDRFFAENDLRTIFGGAVDLSFLDGLHQFEFLLRDFANAEAASGPGSLILMHDCLPLTEEMTVRESDTVRSDPEPYNRMWTGDVWKVIPILRKYRPDLQVTLVDSAPTGLVCVSGLDPASRVLHDRYLEIVREFRGTPNTAAAIGQMYADNPVVASGSILHGQDHSLYFRV